MGKVLVQQLVTLDGFMADVHGGIDFHGVVGDFTETDARQLTLLEHVDNVLLGATTYRMFAAYWPTPASVNEPIAPILNALPKTVVSHTIWDAPWGSHDSVRVDGRDPVIVARELAAGEGDVIVWGSIELTRALFAGDAVDELHLTVVPVTLGDGSATFPVTSG